ncbi:hypothetical protein EON67_10885 [archaeon]|nr:MAG: hypothetical protein EON67_10885 [archaeon]
MSAARVCCFPSRLPCACACRCPSELAYHVQKVFRIDDHMGIAISGLTADARSLCKYVRCRLSKHTPRARAIRWPHPHLRAPRGMHG